ELRRNAEATFEQFRGWTPKDCEREFLHSCLYYVEGALMAGAAGSDQALLRRAGMALERLAVSALGPSERPGASRSLVGQAVPPAFLTLLMRRVLLLWRVQLNLDGLLEFVHLERLAEGLITRGDHLDENGALRDLRHFRDTLLIRAHLPARVEFPAELDNGTALHELDHHVGVIDGLATQRGDLHIDHGRRRFGPGRERAEEHCRQKRKTVTHSMIMTCL